MSGFIGTLQQKVALLPMPAAARAFMLHPAGPFTSKYTNIEKATVASIVFLNNELSGAGHALYEYY